MVGWRVDTHTHIYKPKTDGKDRTRTCLEDGEVDGVTDGEGALLGVSAEQRDVLLARRQGLIEVEREGCAVDLSPGLVGRVRVTRRLRGSHLFIHLCIRTLESTVLVVMAAKSAGTSRVL